MSRYLFLNHWVELNQTCYMTSPHGKGVQEQQFSVHLSVTLSSPKPLGMLHAPCGKGMQEQVLSFHHNISNISMECGDFVMACHQLLIPVVIFCDLNFAGMVRCVKGEGFPHHRNPFEKGDLLIKFDITFPPQNFATEQQLKVSTTW